MAATGLVTGVIAVTLSVVGVAIMLSGLSAVGGELDWLDHGPAQYSTQSTRAVVNQEDRLVHQSLFIGNS